MDPKSHSGPTSEGTHTCPEYSIIMMGPLWGGNKNEREDQKEGIRISLERETREKREKLENSKWERWFSSGHPNKHFGSLIFSSDSQISNKKSPHN